MFHVEIVAEGETDEAQYVMEEQLRRLMNLSETELQAIRGPGDYPPRGVQYGICFCSGSRVEQNRIFDTIRNSKWLRDLNATFSGRAMAHVRQWENQLSPDDKLCCG